MTDTLSSEFALHVIHRDAIKWLVDYLRLETNFELTRTSTFHNLCTYLRANNIYPAKLIYDKNPDWIAPLKTTPFMAISYSWTSNIWDLLLSIHFARHDDVQESRNGRRQILEEPPMFFWLDILLIYQNSRSIGQELSNIPVIYKTSKLYVIYHPESALFRAWCIYEAAIGQEAREPLELLIGGHIKSLSLSSHYNVCLEKHFTWEDIQCTVPSDKEFIHALIMEKYAGFPYLLHKLVSPLSVKKVGEDVLPPFSDSEWSWMGSELFKTIGPVSATHYVVLYKEVRTAYYSSAFGGAGPVPEDYFYLCKNYSALDDAELEKKFKLTSKLPLWFKDL